MAGKTRVIGFENLMQLKPCQIGKAFADNANLLAEKAAPAKVAEEAEKAWKQREEQVAAEARRDLDPKHAAALRRDLGLPIR